MKGLRGVFVVTKCAHDHGAECSGCFNTEMITSPCCADLLAVIAGRPCSECTEHATLYCLDYLLPSFLTQRSLAMCLCHQLSPQTFSFSTSWPSWQEFFYSEITTHFFPSAAFLFFSVTHFGNLRENHCYVSFKIASEVINNSHLNTQLLS